MVTASPAATEVAVVRRQLFLWAAIREYIDVYNEDPTPFVWTKTADQILASIARYAQRITHPA